MKTISNTAKSSVLINCDCVSFEIIDVERRVIILKTLRIFLGQVSVLTLLGSFDSAAGHYKYVIIFVILLLDFF